MPTSRRTFLRRAAAAGAGALVTSSLSGGFQPAPAQARGTGGPAPGPLVIASANGLEAIKRAMEVIRGGGEAVDGVIAGVNIVEDDPNDTSVGYGGLPNEEGVRWFIDQVWPHVHKQFPDLKYFLAGRAMPGWMKELRVPGVEVLGEVEDARAFIASRSVMIVPLFSGSGIRIKIIEGMAAGKTVISTLLGAEGIHYSNGENILIANAPCEFFDMISLCIEDPSRRKMIGNNARMLIESEYDRDAITQRLISFYQQLTD